MTANSLKTAQVPSSKSTGLPDGIGLGHYRLLRKLGQGGFGITYLAVDERTEAKVVVKENLPTFYAVRDDASLQVRPLDVADAVENYAHTLTRFVDEARLLARLNHPNIVRVYEAFEALGTAYYVMPYIEAQELHKVIPTEAVNEAWLLPILKSVLGALDYLHAQNLLHRDLKPGNILLQADGTPILIDFGTARALQTERSATMVGTPGYTPIEQITTHGKLGPWTDVYALGATCYRIITGQLPPEANARLAEEVDPYRPLAHRAELRGRFSATLLGSIDTALTVRAKNRWQSAQSWLEVLENQAQRIPAVCPHPESGVAAEAAVSIPQPLRTEVPTAPRRSKFPLILTLSAAVLLGGAGYGVYAYLDAVAQERLQAEYALAEAERFAQEEMDLLRREQATRLAREEAERKAREEAEHLQREQATRLAREEAERKAREEDERLQREQEARPAREEADRNAACAEYMQAVMAVHAQSILPVTKDIPLPPNAGIVRTLQVLATRGNHEAEFVYSLLMAHGLSMQKDEVAAMQWLRKAAEGGNPTAQTALGIRCEQGTIVAKDTAEAARWYRKAAEQGYAIAQYHLGWCYDRGCGVLKDLPQAIRWYRKAAEQGNADAQNNLGICYQYAKGMPKDEPEAVKWYRKAAESGNARAQRNLGWCYEKGLGVAKDEPEAVKWYRKAAEQGYTTALCNLGSCYRKGLGVAKDEAEAVRLYRMAADQGEVYSQNNLGWCYENGVGVKKNMNKAIEWYREAARRGNTDAQSNLRRLRKSW